METGNEIDLVAAASEGTSFTCYFQVCESCSPDQCDVGELTVVARNCFDTTVGGTDSGCTVSSPACFESTTHDCFACTENDDCADTPATTKCKPETHACVQCLGEGDCGGDEFCDLNTNTCQPDL